MNGSASWEQLRDGEQEFLGTDSLRICSPDNVFFVIDALLRSQITVMSGPVKHSLQVDRTSRVKIAKNLLTTSD